VLIKPGWRRWDGTANRSMPPNARPVDNRIPSGRVPKAQTMNTDPSEDGMNLTELLVTGYDGDKVVLATNLTSTKAASILAATSIDNGSAVEASAALAEPAFNTLVQVLQDLTTHASGCSIRSVV
jgi:hypothetical protein